MTSRDKTLLVIGGFIIFAVVTYSIFVTNNVPAQTGPQIDRTRCVEPLGSPCIGMTAEQVIHDLGQPDHINSTTTPNGTSDQYVYEARPGDGLHAARKEMYLYMQNGVLASFQTSTP